MTRPVRVYRLTVVWPPGVTRRPARRQYLTKAGAEHHADTLRQAGATVTIHPSRPVEWDAPTEEPPP